MCEHHTTYLILLNCAYLGVLLSSTTNFTISLTVQSVENSPRVENSEKAVENCQNTANRSFDVNIQLFENLAPLLGIPSLLMGQNLQFYWNSKYKYKIPLLTSFEYISLSEFFHPTKITRVIIPFCNMRDQFISFNWTESAVSAILPSSTFYA